MKRYISNPGSRYAPVMEPYITDHGSLAIREVGVRDVQMYIEAYRDSCEMSAIIARFERGDTSALLGDGSKPVFMDAVGAPHTVVDFLNLQRSLQRQFDDLPIETRKKFDFSFDKFFSSYGSEDFLSAVYGSPDFQQKEVDA